MNLEELTEKLAHNLKGAQTPPFIFGVSGGQGAGKSTLCAALTAVLATSGLRCLTLALDDFYLPKAARQALAENVHPNCLTRGVPGTHDVTLLMETLDELKNASADTITPLPVFSKSHDDRLAREAWADFQGKPDIILLEGWCVGGRADFLSARDMTPWERKTDPQTIWRNWSLQQSKAYETVWDACDAMLLLRQESFEAVIDSRWLQEQDNAAASGIWQFKSREDVAAFCAHYESWTLAIWQHLPEEAAYTIMRDENFDYRIENSAD